VADLYLETKGFLLDVQASPGVDGDAVMKLLFSASSLKRRKMQKVQIGMGAGLAGGLEPQNPVRSRLFVY
jgi:hypothetical protein